MKISPILSIVLVSFLLVSCTWGMKKPTENVISGENPVVISDNDKTDTTQGEAMEAKPNNDKKDAPETTKTPDAETKSDDKTTKNPEVSTEDLTKELDAYVDDITKGL